MSQQEGGCWSPATLRRILIGPHLAGLRVYGEQVYPAAWPAILSEDTHHALRALLTDPQRKTNPMRPTRHLWSGFLVCGHCGMRMYAYYRQAKSGPVKTLRCHRRLGGCGRLARGAEPIETFLEAAVFEMVRRPAFTQFLNRRSAVPDERGGLLDQIRAGEALQRENLVAYAAPELPEAITHGDLEAERPTLPFYARRRIVETLIARVTLLPVGRGCRRFDPNSTQIEWTF
jgi:site-specific DNA recombinase